MAPPRRDLKTCDRRRIPSHRLLLFVHSVVVVVLLSNRSAAFQHVHRPRSIFERRKTTFPDGSGRFHAILDDNTDSFNTSSCLRDSSAGPRAASLRSSHHDHSFARIKRSQSNRAVFLRQGLLAAGAAAMGAFFSPDPDFPRRPPHAQAAANRVQDMDLPPVAFETKSGLRYYDVRKGEGMSPKWGQVAIIQYEGYVRASPFSKLVLFDDTYARKTPYLVKHGNGRVIRGLDEGIHSMKLGGLRRIVVPLELGYTKTGLGPLPPNAFRRKILVRELGKAEVNDPPGEIIYDVELVSLYDDEADLGYYDDLTFDPGYLQEGMAKSLQELRDKGVKVPSTKSFMTKPEILGSRRQEIELNGLPENMQ